MITLTNEEIIKRINDYQNFPHVHELTCGNDSRHLPLIPFDNDGQIVLKCPTCNFIQYRIPEYVLSDSTQLYMKEFTEYMKEKFKDV